MKLSVEHDGSGGAMYIWLHRGVDCAFSRKLDYSRTIDYGVTGRRIVPIGIRLLGVSMGVVTADLPEREAIEQLLHEYGIKVY